MAAELSHFDTTRRGYAMAGIFISYRREDSAGWTGRLAERLRQKFGSESIFMDIDTIQPGTDFAEALRTAVGACEVVLAMIGPEWSLAKNAEGQARLQDTNDWVRTELTTALSRSIPVVPVLVGGASLPKLVTLPDDLKKLFNYQAQELTDKRWEYDSGQLVQVLEKVVRGAKPERNIAQTILSQRSIWVALVILGLLLALGSLQFLKGMSGTDDRTSQKNESGASESSVLPPPPASKAAQVPVPAVASRAEKPTDNTPDIQQSTVAQQEAERPIATPPATSEKSGTEKVTPSASPTDQKGRSLPAGIEVKFIAGDLIYRLVSIRLEENSSDSWLLIGSFLIRNSGEGVYVEYCNDFRILADGSRHAPTKCPGLVMINNDSENTGEVIFIVPKSVRTVGLRITRGELETVIPIDLKSGVSPSVAQSPGIPKLLSQIAPMQVSNRMATYDFRRVTLEPYNVESFLLRLSIRITTSDSWHGFGGSANFRLILNNLSYEPIRGRYKQVDPNTYADEEVLFIVPKSATQILLRVKDGDNWRNLPIDLKTGKS